MIKPLTKKRQVNKGRKPPRKRRHKGEATKESDRLDDMWKQEVYRRAKNKCEFCGKAGWEENGKIKGLNAHHIFSRGNWDVRWDVDNGVCLCPGHHTLTNESFHKAPAEMLEWIKGVRGVAWYDDLLVKARQKRDIREIKEEAHNKLKAFLGEGK